MLINKNATTEPGDVRCFYLTTGEEFVGEIDEVTEDFVKLTRPLKLVLTQNGAVLLPSSFSTGQQNDMTKHVVMEIKHDHIVSTFVCSDVIEIEYKKVVTGIEVANILPA